MLSLLLVLFVVVGLGLSLFLTLLLLLTPKKYKTFTNDDPTIIIAKIVESHRESLPINSSHGWNLVPSNCSLRCWKKELTFNILGCPVTVYGSSKEINCAAVILLNVIADISTWPEWDIQAQEQVVHLELPSDPLLHGDPYMQCDQLVLTTSKLKSQPEVMMYRFGNLERNGTGWILLWNAKKLDWVLYIVQPAEDDYLSVFDPSESKCLLTAIWGCRCNGIRDSEMSTLLCSKLLNLSEAIDYSQLTLRPFEALMQTSSLNNPHIPTIRSALNDLPEKPCVLLVYEKKHQHSSSKSHLLAVVPSSSEKELCVDNITGFVLVSHSVKGSSKSSAINGEAISEEKQRSRRRHKKIETENRRSSSLSAPVRRKLPELTVTQAEEESKTPQRAASHSFLDVLFQKRRSSDTSDKKSRSPSPRRNSSPTRGNKYCVQKISSLSSQEDVSQPHMQASDTSDAESSLLNVSCRLQNGKLDVKSLGSYSISVLLKENHKASQVDLSEQDDQKKVVNGGWIFKELHKDILILKKTSTLGSSLMISHFCKGIIPSSHVSVWKTVRNPSTRYMYDDSVKKITVLNDYSEEQKLIHMYNESVTLLHKEVQDFCILQTERKSDDQYIVCLHSVEDDSCPPMKDVTRGTVIASGWTIKPTVDQTSCQVTYLIQMIVRTPEVSLMEEISNIQSQCIHNLSVYLTTKPPSFLPLHCDEGMS